jgi:pimeloyl-ACP methyl ester carboxylesterase
VVELLDHLKLDAVALIGTSRGGLNAMGLAASVPERLLGVALNDIGPELDPSGLAGIMHFLGRKPATKTFEDAANALEKVLVGFDNVPKSRWLEEAKKHFVKDGDGLNITYDPKLRDAVEAGGDIPDLWPFFDALAGKPLCCIRGEGSDLLSAETLSKMRIRRPDMIATTVPDRGHIPFLDEPPALQALKTWLGQLK